MTNKEHYTEQLRNDQKNIENLKQERKKAWEAGNRNLYRTCTNAIREINAGINAYKDYLD